MTAILSADAVRFCYGRQCVLEGVTLAVQPGEIIALVGPNGAGKTTLLKLLAGLLMPSAGGIHVSPPRARTVAYLSQSEEVPSDWSVREVVELGRLPYVGIWRDLTPQDQQAVHRAMDRTAILHLAARLVGSLSGGERQRVALARALAQEPRALLLDEPTTHLDLRHQVDLFCALRVEASRGAAVVTVMHDLSFASHADRCVVLSGGAIRMDGAPGDVLRPDLLREVYGTDVEVVRTADGRSVVVAAQGSATQRPQTFYDRS